MNKIEIDPRIHSIISQSTNQKHRSLFVLQNGNFRKNTSILYEFLSQKTIFLPTILWCYSKSEKIRNDKKKLKNEKDELTINPDFIKKVNYSEIDVILGNTVEMLVLEHFKFITPNILAKAIETVQGGGMVVIFLDHTDHLNFNNRLVQSFIESKCICVLNENLNVQNRFDLSKWKTEKNESTNSKFKNRLCVTYDQDNSVSEIDEIMRNRNNKNILLLKASRGRGKSAALGISVSNAIEQNYSNIHIIAPHIENVQMLFDFIIKGLNEKGYKENADYKIQKIFKGRSYINKIVVNKKYRQVIQYHNFLEKIDRYPDLLVIDEAAAIPIPILKKLLRCNLVLMASTCDGYEGTGRSLTMKFVESLKKNDSDNPYFFKELELNESIRYGKDDPIEDWLNETLILKNKEHKNKFCPSPNECELFYVNKKVLFSYHPASEKFLKQLISIFVTSHYKNTPDDVKILADEKNHHVFTFLSPMIDKKLPRIICAVHIAVEGCVEGKNKAGNLIPWTVSEQFLDASFLQKKGIRIVRISVHPDYQSMGYGTKMVNSIIDLFNKGKDENLTQKKDDSLLLSMKDIAIPKIDFLGVSMGLNQRILKFWSKNQFYPIYIKQTKNFNTGDYSCILIRNSTSQFNNFYDIFKNRFLTLSNFLWKEFSIEMALMLIKFDEFVLKDEFKENIHPQNNEIKQKSEADVNQKNNELKSISNINIIFSQFDYQRCTSYMTGYSHLNIISDILPKIALDYFLNRKNYLTLAQESILFAIGIQLKSFEEVAIELEITRNNVEVLLKKIFKHFLMEQGQGFRKEEILNQKESLFENK